jgi:putative transposase
MIYQFMRDHRFMFPVERMAKVLNVSRSGYYAWIDRPPSKRARENARLDVEIKAVYMASKRRYGSVKITRKLAKRGKKYGRTRVANRMRKMGVRSIVRKRFKVTTDSKHTYPIAPNLLNRNFRVLLPNQVWVSDITYIRTKSGWAYLTVFIDLYSRMVIGWAVSTSLSHEMVLEAFQKALWRRKPGKGLIVHSDRGVQYACDEFRKTLNKHGCIQSMSRKGDCWDNAVAESFFKTVKTEWVYHVDLQDIHHVRRETFEYLEIFYNRERLHATLGYQSPAEYEELEYKKCA